MTKKSIAIAPHHLTANTTYAAPLFHSWGHGPQGSKVTLTPLAIKAFRKAWQWSSFKQSLLHGFPWWFPRKVAKDLPRLVGTLPETCHLQKHAMPPLFQCDRLKDGHSLWETIPWKPVGHASPVLCISTPTCGSEPLNLWNENIGAWQRAASPTKASKQHIFEGFRNKNMSDAYMAYLVMSCTSRAQQFYTQYGIAANSNDCFSKNKVQAPKPSLAGNKLKIIEVHWHWFDVLLRTWEWT